jgi:hypothetical protein
MNPPNPVATVPATLARLVGAADRVDEEAVREALEAAGWSVQPPPADDGLPSPGVLVALRGRLG